MCKLDGAAIKRSLDAVQNWVERRDYKGYDPGDGLTSFLRPLTFGHLFAERLLQQADLEIPDKHPPAAWCRAYALDQRSRLHGLGLSVPA